ncbi:MAG: rhodanese-like domain-containing protein [Candidatus Obscuribacterales bacterium]|nr:rhodanese-like domain-containing protein [Candidatus Obscuribacterales bacterium]
MDSFRRISSDQLREKQKRGEEIIVLDLRTPEEFEKEHIGGSLNIPLETLTPTAIQQLLENHSRNPFFLICSTGKLAYKAAEIFYDYGHFEVIVIAGGLLAWRVLGFPLQGKKL